MIIEKLSSREEQVLQSQELTKVLGGLPTDTVPLTIGGAIVGGARSIYTQLSDDGSVDAGTFIQDVNGGAVTGFVTSLITPT